MVWGLDRAKWLNGTWVLKTDRSVRVVVKDGYWETDAQKIAIRNRGRNSLGQLVVSMSVDGDAISGTLNDDDELVWLTGEVWVLDMLECAFKVAMAQAELSKGAQLSLEQQTDTAARSALQTTRELGFGKKAQKQQATKLAVKWTASECLDSGKTPMECAKKVGVARRRHGRKGSHIPLETQVLSMFEQFDKDGCGKITAKQLRHGLRAINPQTFTKEVCHRFFESLDSDCNGEIDFVEMCDWMYCRTDLSLDLLEASDRRAAELARHRRFDGRYVHKEDAELMEVIEQGKVLLRAGRWVPIKLEGIDGFSINVDGKDHGAKIVHDELIWDDGDIWVLPGEQEIKEAAAFARQTSRDSGEDNEMQDEAGDGHHALAKNVARARRLSGSGKDTVANPDKVVELFEKIDRDGSGDITYDEFLLALGNVNPSVFNHQTVTQLFANVDSNSNGSIDFTELISWIYADRDEAVPLAVLSAASKYYRV
eukprot:TRINITY_DN14638_c0_g1_i2.p1 TRINITY_DN14638_c0_g1~~TRINITY_DN14638_c0_g1_i2.p1  ORF type:complete len:482 (-),score=102.67 TRINITY_DN14638_c0_g1_i2:470-1915(-)